MSRAEIRFGLIALALVALTITVASWRHSSKVYWEGNVRRRPFYSGDENPAIEYRLPCKELPAESRAKLHPWIRSMVGKSTEQVETILNERWRTLDPSLARLRKRLAEFRPISILVFNDESFVGLYRESQGDMLFLPPPLQAEQVERLNSMVGGEPGSAVEAFFRNFAGLREDRPGVAGNFVYDKPNAFMAYVGPELETPWIEGYDWKWESALVFYHAANGDLLLMQSMEKLAWYVPAEQVIREFPHDFEYFLQVYASDKRTPVPFDSYDPAEWGQ